MKHRLIGLWLSLQSLAILLKIVGVLNLGWAMVFSITLVPITSLLVAVGIVMMITGNKYGTNND